MPRKKPETVGRPTKSKLAELRRKAGYTRANCPVPERVNMSLERGRSVPSKALVHKLSQLYACSHRDIVAAWLYDSERHRASRKHIAEDLATWAGLIRKNSA